MNRQVSVQGEAVVVVEQPDFSGSVPQEWQQQLGALVDSYVALKDELVKSDAAAVQKRASQVTKALQGMDMLLLQGPAHDYWMQQLPGLQGHIENIRQSTDLEEQREQFDFLSRVLIPTVQVYGLSGQKVYVQHCPMANDNNGADWLSYEDQIRNPYFGDRMLKCGTVTDTIAGD